MTQKKRNLTSRLIEIGMIFLVRAVFALERILGIRFSSAAGGFLAETFSPLLSANRIALENLRLVYPEKSDRERRQIAKGAWNNLGRVGAEYALLNRLGAIRPETQSGMYCDVTGAEHLRAVQEQGKPVIFFSAHLANWELCSVIACQFKLDMTSIFREPNDPVIARIVHEIRSQTMGPLQPARSGAASKMIRLLENGHHMGILIDQHLTKGILVDFMGQKARANPVVAKLARKFESPVLGVRCIRLPENRFRIDITPPMEFERDAKGLIDIESATQHMTALIESWIQEYPEQWLWMHRRWRV